MSIAESRITKTQKVNSNSELFSLMSMVHHYQKEVVDILREQNAEKQENENCNNVFADVR